MGTEHHLRIQILAPVLAALVAALAFLGSHALASTEHADPVGPAVPAAAPEQLMWGDGDCSGSINPIDSLKILRNDAGLSSVSVQGLCPQLGVQLLINGVLRFWGDLDCSGGGPNPVDSLKTLRYDAGLSVSKVGPACPNAGSPVNLGAPATPTPVVTATPSPTAAGATATPAPSPTAAPTVPPLAPPGGTTSCPGNAGAGFPLAITDDAPGSPVVLALSNPGGGIITDLDICLNIDHTWVGDLFVEVEHVDTGTTVTLVDRPGLPGLGIFGCSGSNIRALMADEAASLIEDECTLNTPTIDGAFRPNQPLSAFDGEVFDGEWEIRFSDRAALSTGSVIGATVFWLE